MNTVGPENVFFCDTLSQLRMSFTELFHTILPATISGHMTVGNRMSTMAELVRMCSEIDRPNQESHVVPSFNQGNQNVS